jgi:hypothetical protein
MIWIFDEVTKALHCRLRCFEMTKFPPRQPEGYYVGDQAQSYVFRPVAEKFSSYDGSFQHPSRPRHGAGRASDGSQASRLGVRIAAGTDTRGAICCNRARPLKPIYRD